MTGLGTWQSPPGEVRKAVEHALSVGYRHIDAAYVYGNEDEVGQGLAAGFKSGIKREDIFVTTKFWCSFHTKPAEEALDLSLKSLGLDYVDLYLIHWPVAMNADGNDPKFPTLPDGSRDLVKDWSHVQTWKAMEKLMQTGKVKAIGVANYSKKYLEELLEQATVKPATNQIENHPYLPQQEIVDFCKENDILITAYSPLGSAGSPLIKEREIQDLAKKYDVTPGCILISYHVARGSVVIPKSVTPSRIEENLKIIQLDASDMKALDHISTSKPTQRFVYPAFGVSYLQFFRINP